MFLPRDAILNKATKTLISELCSLSHKNVVCKRNTKFSLTLRGKQLKVIVWDTRRETILLFYRFYAPLGYVCR